MTVLPQFPGVSLRCILHWQSFMPIKLHVWNQPQDNSMQQQHITVTDVTYCHRETLRYNFSMVTEQKSGFCYRVNLECKCYLENCLSPSYNQSAFSLFLSKCPYQITRAQSPDRGSIDTLLFWLH